MAIYSERLSLPQSSQSPRKAAMAKRNAKIDNHFSPSSQHDEACLIRVVFGAALAGLVCGVAALLASI